MATDNNTLTIASYPTFVANQALTDTQLNSILAYTNEQDRQSRINLLGTGILCGLQVQMNAKSAAGATTIFVSQGCGITSDGQLAQLKDATYTHFRSVADAGITLPKTIDSPGAPDVADVVELVTADTLNASPLDKNAKTGQPLDLTNKVVVLLLQKNDQPYDNCAQSCDELGGKTFITPKVLLVPKTTMDAAIRNGYHLVATDNLEEVFNGKYILPDLFIERFGYFAQPAASAAASSSTVDLTLVNAAEIFNTRYQAICGTAISRISAAYKVAHKVTAPIYSHRDFSATAFDDLQTLLESKLKEFVDPPAGTLVYGIQYFYDYLKDLILAYNEFTSTAFDLMEDCCPDEGRFPEYLMLGEVIPSQVSTPSLYRNYFTQPPVYNGNNLRRQEVDLLYDRMLLLKSSFSIPAGSTPTIIPGKSPYVPLSERPLPFYYPPIPLIAKPLSILWNYDLSRRNRVYNVPSYHTINGPANTGRNYNLPLLYNIDDASFFRIEGHIGKPSVDCLEAINKLRQNFNLPFDVILLKLGSQAPPADIQFDYHLQELQLMYTGLRNNLLCVLKEMDGSQALQNTLTEQLQEFDFSSFRKEYDSLFTGKNAGNIHDCSVPAFEAVYTAFNKRITDFNDQQLFHKFAGEHPGMEHLAGVSKGGTFIMVYDERSLAANEIDSNIESMRKAKPNLSNGMLEIIKREFAARPEQTVVGDFCLPYIFSSKLPPLNFVVAKPRPILLLEKNAYCANDETEYPFFIHPKGGKVTGPAASIIEKPDGFYFKPDATGIASGTTSIVYTVDDATDILPVTILPVPDTTFSGLLPTYCTNVETKPKVELTPQVTGGEFSADAEGVIVVEDGKTYFNTAAAVPGVPVNITYRILNSETTCTNFTMETVTVFVEPDAAFTLADETTFCVNSAPVTITTTTPGGNFTTSIQGNNVSGIISMENNVFQFNPGAQIINAQSPVEVTIIHTIQSNSCTGVADLVVTVLPLANAGFIKLETSYCINHPDLPLIPETAGGTFAADKEGAIITDGNGGNLLHLPAVTPGDTVNITYSLAASGSACANSSSQRVTVLPLPNADFDMADSACTNDQIIITPVTPEGNFTTIVGGNEVDNLIQLSTDGSGKYIFYPGKIDAEGTAFEVTVIYKLDGNPCSNSSKKIISIRRAPAASFNIDTMVPQNEQKIFTIRLTGITPLRADDYIWDFGDGTGGSVKPGKGNAIQRTVERQAVGNPGKQVSVKLTVSLNGCKSDVFTQTYTVPDIPVVIG